MNISNDISAGTGFGAAAPSGEVGAADFMTLLTTQLRNQNPLQPMSDADFLGQLAQFSQLEQSQTQTRTLESLRLDFASDRSLQGLAQASGLIDRDIDFLNSETGAQESGRVTGVSFGEGLIQLQIGDRLVPLGNVVSIQAAEL